MYFITVSGGEKKKRERTEKNPSQPGETATAECLTASLTQTKAGAGLSQALAPHVDRS